MATFHYPLSIPISAAGVTERDFHHVSAIHGAGHVNRVIYLALLIARTSGHRHLLPAIWAASYLHDLARMGDGRCTVHGELAVQHFLPRKLALFRAAGVKPEDLPAICTAVTLHCRDIQVPADHPHFLVWSILRDADAMDRVRLGDFDPERLIHRRSKELSPLAPKLLAATSPTSTLDDVWCAAADLIGHPPGMLDKHPYHWDEAETGPERMRRRLAAATARDDFDSRLWSSAIGEEQFVKQACLAAIGARSALASAAAHVLPQAGLAVATETAAAHRLVPVTATRALARFHAEGTYRGFWEAGPSWHTDYVDDPADVRVTHATRLFGERDAYVAYGVLLDPESPRFAVRLAELRQVYGPDLIVWNRDVLTSATFCLNDSQKANRVLPFTEGTWAKAQILFSVAAAARHAWPTRLMPWSDLHGDYWEFQVHRKLTLRDVGRFMISEGQAAA